MTSHAPATTFSTYAQVFAEFGLDDGVRAEWQIRRARATSTYRFAPQRRTPEGGVPPWADGDRPTIEDLIAAERDPDAFAVVGQVVGWPIR